MSDTEGPSPELVKLVKEWVDLDDQIKAARLDIKVVNEQKSSVQSQIEEHMDTNGIDTIKINGGNLRLADSTTTKPLPKAKQRELIAQHLGEDAANDLFTILDDSREKTTVKKLKRTANRKKKE